MLVEVKSVTCSNGKRLPVAIRECDQHCNEPQAIAYGSDVKRLEYGEGGLPYCPDTIQGLRVVCGPEFKNISK